MGVKAEALENAAKVRHMQPKGQDALPSDRASEGPPRRPGLGDVVVLENAPIVARHESHRDTHRDGEHVSSIRTAVAIRGSFGEAFSDFVLIAGVQSLTPCQAMGVKELDCHHIVLEDWARLEDARCVDR
jgi:hypothetical protein